VLILPQLLPEHPAPLTLHVTAVLDEPVMLERNCCVVPTVTIAVVGEIVTTTGTIMVTVAVPVVVPSATDVAVTVIWAGLGTLDGAVYKPAEVMKPQADPEQPAPLRVHVTPVLAVPVTFAVNCCVLFVATWTGVGVTATAIFCTMITGALADFVESAADVAVTVTKDGFGTVDGAV
jgi:hypothetical protein